MVTDAPADISDPSPPGPPRSSSASVHLGINVQKSYAFRDSALTLVSSSVIRHLSLAILTNKK